MASGDSLMLRSARRVLRNARLILRSARPNVVIAADFTGRGDMAYRLAGEIRHLADAGAFVLLVQSRRPSDRDSTAAEILTCLRRTLAHKTRPDDVLACDTLILHRPAIADDFAGLLERIDCEEKILVCHDARDISAVRCLDPRGRHVSKFATNPLVSDSHEPGIIEGRYWTPVLDPLVVTATRAPVGRKIALCWLTTASEIPSEVRALQEMLPADSLEHHFISGAATAMVPNLENLSLDRLMAGIDIFVATPDRPLPDLPDMIIAAALQAGKPVILPSDLNVHYGVGPIYHDNADLQRTLGRAITALGCGGGGGQGARRAEFVARCARGPITRLHGRKRRPTTRGPQSVDRPVLFLPSNGVGVGHLTRLLAIARRIDRKAVFASQAPALQAIRDFGFAAEYIPSHAAVGGEFEPWDSWFCSEIGRVADAYDPSLVVYDGNHLSPGLIHAVASRRDCRLAWVRRGMWGCTTSRFLANAKWCDLVIEPEDLAGERDEGATAQLRDEVRMVDPIQLLDPDELPDRHAAAKALALDPSRPACLVQLGSGHNRDLLSLLDRIIHDLRQHPSLQIAIAEWITGSVPLNLWPEVTVLRGFPINQYIRAFDFCVSAAGYNAFHEMIGYRVPTIFLANRAPGMDDQYARAKFAQDKASAFEISETELGDFPELAAMMMQAKAREFLVAHCAKLARPNGAAEAAEALGLLADATGMAH